MNLSQSLAERFMRYVQIDTQSDPFSNTFPTTEKQKNLSRLLAKELEEMGCHYAHMDDYGYVYATIPATGSGQVPAICFCSHVDTAPDASGTDVKPRLHTNYDGGRITFPDDPGLVLDPADYPYLQQKKGEDIITASGGTLLGADDKAGVAIIMELASFLLRNPDIPHGDIRILFTPDEEVGMGTAKLDIEKLNARFAYTLDGGDLGDLENETFSADSASLVVHGVSTHPGWAKGKMVNAIKVAADIVAALPADRLSPETTEQREGFVHPVSISGNAEKAQVNFIVRDFETRQLQGHAMEVLQLAEEVAAKWPGARVEWQVNEQYRNMKEVLDQHPQVVDYARKAMEENGLRVKMEPIRGGTDGSKLSFMGLPCPNLFTGMQNIHSKLEWVSVQDMEKAVLTLVSLSRIWHDEAQ